MRIISQASTMMGASVANLVVRLVGLAVLARFVSPAEFGWVALALAITSVLSDLAQLDLRDAIIRIKRPDQRIINVAFLILSLSSMSIATAIFLLNGVTSRLFDMPELAPVLSYMSLVVLFDTFAVIPEALIIRAGRVRAVAINTFLSYGLFFTPIAIGGAFAGWGEWALVAGYLARSSGYALLSVILLLRTPLHLGRTRRGPIGRVLQRLLAHSAGGTANRMLTQGSRNVDNVIVGAFIGANSLGIYSRSYALAATPIDALLGMTIRSALFPAFSRIRLQEERLRMALLQSISASLMILVPLSMTAVGLAPWLVTLALGDQWKAAIFPFQLIMVGMSLRFAPRLATALARATGQVNKALMMNIGGTISVAIFVGIGAQWGLKGAAAGLLSAAVCQWGLAMQVSARIVRARIRDLLGLHMHPAILGLVMATTAYFAAATARGLVESQIAAVIIGGITSIAIAGTLTLTCPQLMLGTITRNIIASTILDLKVAPGARKDLLDVLIARIRPV